MGRGTTRSEGQGEVTVLERIRVIERLPKFALVAMMLAAAGVSALLAG